MTVPAGSPEKGSESGSSRTAEKIVDVERQGGQTLADLPFPVRTRSIPVDLDPVPVRVAEVERLADEVIGQPDERDAVARGMREPASEVDALGHEQGEVVEARISERRSRIPLLGEHEQLVVAGAEPRVPVARSSVSRPISRS